MPDIEVAGGLVPGVVNTPLDARTRRTALADIPSIPNPAVGMHIYILETGREYIVKTLKAKTVGGIEVADRQIDSYEPIPGKADLDAKAASSAVAALGTRMTAAETALDGKAASSAVETLGGRVAVLEEASGASIKTLIFNKPADGLHLIIKLAGPDGTRANAVTIIDTYNVAADRAKVKAYLDTGTDGSWVECPADGFPTPYDNAPVAVDLSVLTSIPAILYYAWYADASTLSDWQSTIFPVPGGAGGGGAGGGGSEGVISNVVVSATQPSNPTDGMIWIQE